MMRQLTKQQRKYLDKVFEADKSISSFDDLSPLQVQELEAMNNTEILWQEAERYLSDKEYGNLKQVNLAKLSEQAFNS